MEFLLYLEYLFVVELLMEFPLYMEYYFELYSVVNFAEMALLPFVE
jgi:hypothetical protein